MRIPADIHITKIDAALLIGTRPRLVGRNARLPVHGQNGRDAVVRLHTDAGIVGWGWSAAKREEADALLGKPLTDVFDPETGTVDGFLRFDLALWDLAGRVLGKSVSAMLGNAGENPVSVYDGSIYIDEIDPDTGRDDGIQPMLDAVKMGLGGGFDAFKVKVGRGHRWMEKNAGLKRDIEVLHAIRDLIGERRILLIDANNGYTPDEAREVMRQAGDCDIYWFEEPFPESREECCAFKDFLREGGWKTQIADGEGSESRDAEFTEIVRAGGIDVVQFDLRGYTLTRWLRYLPVIAETGTTTAPHNWGSHLSGFYIPQFGCGTPHFSMGETDTMTMPGVIADGYRRENGRLVVPDAPGFGLELDPSAFAVAQRENGGWSAAG